MSIIDWVAFTLPILHTETEPSQNAFRARVMNVTVHMDELMPLVTAHSLQELIPCTPQRPYRHAWQCPVIGWRINADWKRKEALIVFNGAACEKLKNLGFAAQAQVLAQVEQTGTRLDIATDIRTEVRPKEVEKFGWTKRVSTTSMIVSGTGETLYIGSRKSEAFCRVYRYNAPHPRSPFLRVEFELKKDRARAVAQLAFMNSIDHAARSVAATFEFGHVTVEHAFEGKVSKIITASHDRSLASTERWLLTQCAPAFVRLVREGVIDDPKEWVEKYLLGGLQGDETPK